MPAFHLPSSPRTLDIVPGTDLVPIGLWLGKGNGALEVAAYSALRVPTKTTLLDAYRKRRGGRATPVLVVVEYNQGTEARCALIGPSGEDPPFVVGVASAQAVSICKTAVEQGDRHVATRFLANALGSLGTAIPGLRNEGFLAYHELQTGVIERADWSQAVKKGIPLLSRRGPELVRNLGYTVEDDASGKHSILLASNAKRAVALYLNQDETPEQAAARFSNIDPISYALAIAKRENVDYVVLTTPTSIRIYPVHEGVGVAQSGRSQTYVELNLNVLNPAQAGFLWLLFSADAVQEEGSLGDILTASKRFRSRLGERLRERVYDDVIPGLATALARARNVKRPKAEDLEATYQMALHHLFRVLFIAYAEDKDLLPYGSNSAYQARSLKQKASELLEAKQKGAAYGSTTRLWKEVEALCTAIDKGDASIGVPPYNGGLFTTDAAVNREGAELAKVALDDATYAPILTALLVDAADGKEGPVDFRSLGVREFGTIYEGLLESELSLAETDLVADKKTKAYRPLKGNETAGIVAGTYYLASTSGTRKASGSYFTKDFAVKHLLQHALEPALTDHLSRLEAMKDDEAAGAAFFDFRVADISMGSGHFLVAAIDHIEVRLSGYLAHRNLPAVRNELNRLREESHRQMGDLLVAEIEDARLLRRQIARRCIYGVDLKPAAVELARVSIWIHTFVPGLPLSLLDQHLVVGNSLTGIGTVAEADRLLSGSQEIEVKTRKGAKGKATGKVHTLQSIFNASAEELMQKAATAMLEVGRLGDATMAEVRQAQSEWRKAKKAAEPWVALLDILAAGRLDEGVARQAQRIYAEWSKNPAAILADSCLTEARGVLEGLNPCHFPAIFPEVFFARDRPGFDVILGNPPWEEATVEEDKFWLRLVPGLAALQQGEQEATKARLRVERRDLVKRYEEAQAAAERLRILLGASDYPGMGTGDPDLYKAFSWRFWRLLGPGGYMGVVLPRSALAAKGSAEWRTAILTEGCARDLTFLLNKGEWVFDGVHPQYTVCLTALQKLKPTASTPVPLRGPFSGPAAYEAGMKQRVQAFQLQEVLSWTDTASLPLLPNQDSIEPFGQLRAAPRLDATGTWQVQPYAEFHATHDKKANGGVIEFPDKPPKGYWPVFAGESFDLWTPDTGNYYGWADAEEGCERVFAKRLASANREISAFSGMSEAFVANGATLACRAPRIAFRDVTNRTNTRTIIAALLPGQVFLTNKAPYLVWKRGDAKDQAFLLGVLSSLVLDWYARRFVEINLNFFIINPFPVPRPGRSDTRWTRSVDLAGRLAAPDERFRDWAKSVGVQFGPLEPKTKEDMIHELDAVVAHLYELKREHLIHIFETFHEGWDYKLRLDATLKHFDAWEGKT